jgi:oligogalacturonide lyase
MANPHQTEWPSEREESRDEQTGARVIRLTGAPGINHPLYYLTNSFTADGRSLVFASDRAGKMDLYKVGLGLSLDDGAIQRLTDVDGLQPFSGNVVGDDVYFSTTGRIHRLGVQDRVDRVLVDRPGCDFGEITVSGDGNWLASLITRGQAAGLLVARTDGTEARVILEGSHALYHPQFHPCDPTRLIYSADPPDPRIWTVRTDGSGDRCVYSNRPDEWFVHETFLGRDDRLIVVHWHRGLCTVDLRDGTLELLTGLSAWHIAATRDGTRIVCDTHLPDVGLCLIDPSSGAHRVLCQSRASSQGWQWHQPLPLTAAGAAPGWATMVEQASGETAYGPQHTHPHPSFSPDGRWVSFTSDQSGSPQVYVAEVPPMGDDREA